jgi:hypothetical protein
MSTCRFCTTPFVMKIVPLAMSSPFRFAVMKTMPVAVGAQ